MIINEQKLINRYIKCATKSKSFKEVRVRTYVEKEDFSPFYIYKYFENYDDLKMKSAKSFVKDNLETDYINFEDTCYSTLVYETLRYFRTHEHRNVLFLDDYCGKIVMENYYIPTLSKFFDTSNKEEIITKYIILVGMLIQK